jgi:hypothetical protein
LNQRYNALLMEHATGPHRDLDLATLTAEVHRSPWLEHTFAGRYRPQPIFLEAEQRQALERDLVDLLHLIRSLPERLFDDDAGRMCDAVGMTPLQRRAVLETWRDQEVFLSRADLYEDSTGFKVLEFNIVSALGGFENAEISKAMLAAPFLRRFVEREGLTFPDTIDVIADHIHRAAEARGLPPRPRMVLVEWPTNIEKEGQRMAYWAGAFSERGFDATICHTAELRSEGGRLYFEDRPIDILYRYFLVEDLLDAEEAQGLLEPILDAHRRGNVLLSMGFAGELLGNKRTLALLSDDANRRQFSSRELDLIDRVVPWTRTLRPGQTRWREHEGDLLELAQKHQEHFVLKPSLLHGALGFYAGWTMSPQDWRRQVESAAQGPYVIQERVTPKVMELAGDTPEGVRLEPCTLNWGVFVVDDRIAGGIIRATTSDQPVISVGTGALISSCFWRAG